MYLPKYFFTLLFILFVFSIYSFPLHVLAEERDDNNPWEFRISPYAWLAGMEGQVASIAGLPPAEVDVNFYDDILGNINGAFMLLAEAKKDRFGITGDVVYTDIEGDAAIPGRNYTKISSRTKNWLFSLAAFYRFMETKQYSIDGLAGIRLWSVDSGIELSGDDAGAISADNKEDWFDPLVGIRGMTMIGGSKFFLNGAFLLGGFGVSSDFMWDINMNLGYQWSHSVSTTIGYRYLDVDYENKDFIYDVVQDGVTLGFSWQF